MSSTTFIDQVTPVPASWLNDVNTATYTTVPALSTAVAGKAASGANTDITSLASPAIAAATATTQATNDSTTKVATTAFVQQELTNQAVKLTGNQTIAGTKTFSTQPVLPQAPVLGTSVATTSGTSVSFTGIPSWVKRITLTLVGVSSSGTGDLGARIGTSGIFTVSGYLGTTQTVANTVAAGSNWGSSALLTHSTGNLAASTYHGIITFTLSDSSTNKWIISGILGRSDAIAAYFLAGSLTLAGALDRVGLASINGTDTFDAGSVNILYE